MPSGITQCYLPPGRGDFAGFTQAEAGTRFSDPAEGCKAELTWVVVISQDSLNAKYGHLSQEWPGSVMAGNWNPQPKVASPRPNHWTTEPTLDTNSFQLW